MAVRSCFMELIMHNGAVRTAVDCLILLVFNEGFQEQMRATHDINRFITYWDLLIGKRSLNV